MPQIYGLVSSYFYYCVYDCNIQYRKAETCEEMNESATFWEQSGKRPDQSRNLDSNPGSLSVDTSAMVEFAFSECSYCVNVHLNGYSC